MNKELSMESRHPQIIAGALRKAHTKYSEVSRKWNQIPMEMIPQIRDMTFAYLQVTH